MKIRRPVNVSYPKILKVSSAVADDVETARRNALIPTNAIGHVMNCKCVVCRNTNFDYIKKRKLLALFTAVREYTTERKYQNVEACRLDQDRLEREMLSALNEAEKVILSEHSNAAGAPPLSPNPSSEHIRQMERVINEFQDTLGEIMSGGPEGWKQEWWDAMCEFIKFVPASPATSVESEHSEEKKVS